MHFSIGYSEPEAGTDLASLTTRAVRDGDEYVINGQKMWTSLIQYADYVWLAVRTDPEAPKHKGLSMLLVPTDAPGLLLDAGAHHGRRHDQRHLLRGRAGAGDEPRRRGERGLAAHHQPAQPRAGGAVLGRQRAAPARRRAALGPRHRAARRPAGDRPGVGAGAPGPGPRQDGVPQAHQLEDRLGREEGRRHAGRLGHQGVRHRALHRGLPAAHGGARRGGRGPERLARVDPAQPRSSGCTARPLILTFGGGTNEVQRDIIRMVGLGMPRAPRF